VSIHWPILRRLASRPLAVACIDDRKSYRSIEILVAATNLAADLEARCHSRTVGILCPTSAATPIVALACWMIGKVAVPMNYLLSKGELQAIIDDCQTDTIVAVGPMLDFMGFTPRVTNLLKLETLDLGRAPLPFIPASAEDQDLGVLLYTSGTSGRPKGVMLSHGNISANIRQCVRAVHLNKKTDVIFGVLPQFHSFGLTVLSLFPLAAGIKVVFTARFVPHKIIKSFREHRPTFFVAIPSMYNALLNVKDAAPDDFASIKFLVSGAEPLPDAVSSRFFERFGRRISEGYGLTETSPGTNFCFPWDYRPHSVGKPLPELEQIIVDPATDQILPTNADGEIRMRGPNVMQGYFNRPEETAAAFDARGFLRTGDIGRFDDHGHLYITGRLKEMMIVAGENVFPREIEDVLMAHPSVEAAGVTSVQDPTRGELPIAFVQMREGQAFDQAALMQFCRDKLAGYKVPREVRCVEALPRNPTGKVMRRELKALI
jgi:long-chain acyl-CoA synthetase